MNLNDDSIQIAMYPGNGTRFVRHADATPFQASNRRLTALLYLNKEIKGGTLKLYRKERTLSSIPMYEGMENEVEIVPEFNRLVIFPSGMHCY